MIKKILFILFLSSIFCGIGFAESYYFKECQLSENVYGNYLIDLEKNKIKVNLKTTDGSSQELTDEIELITKNKIISKKIQHKKNKDFYLQYQLKADSKTIIRQYYKKESGIDLLRPSGQKKEGYCTNVKADWNKDKIEKTKVSEDQEKVIKAQDQISKKQGSIPKCQGNVYSQWSNCKGIYKNEIGHLFIGQFKDGKILKGNATYAGGSKYVGQFKDGKPHGKGIFTYSDGSNYHGKWKDGKNHGSGVKTWKDGKKYTGQFKDDKLHGEGTLAYPDGSKYVGQFRDNKRHGQGTLTYSDRQTFTGQFVDGFEHGTGACTDKNGTKTKCKILEKLNTKDSAGKNRRKISIKARKWVVLAEYELSKGKAREVVIKLENSFKRKAFAFCSSYGNFEILEKKIEILEIDEVPAFGIEPKAKLGIFGTVECR